MNRRLIGALTIVLTSLGITGSSWALPAVPPSGAELAAPSPPLIFARYHHYYYYHRRHYAYWRHRYARWPHRQLAEARVADAVKPGEWEFTSQMQMPGGAQPPSGVQLPQGVQVQPGAGMKSTYSACVDSEKAVPTDPRGACKIDNVQRRGATVTWAGSCTTAQGAVRSEGVARYSGETMEANLTTHVPGANGRTMDTTQHITGHYLGVCTK